MNTTPSSKRFTVPPDALAAARRRRETRLQKLSEGLSRRHFLRAAAATPGLVMAAGLWSKAFGNCGAPRPIPQVIPLGGGLPDIHIQLPGLLHPADADPSVITDFNGHVGYAVIDGTGLRTQGAIVTAHPYEVDLRFMTGEYVTGEGQHCHGTFALI